MQFGQPLARMARLQRVERQSEVLGAVGQALQGGGVEGQGARREAPLHAQFGEVGVEGLAFSHGPC